MLSECAERLKQAAERHLAQVEKAVITVPAHFDDYAARLPKMQAAWRAGKSWTSSTSRLRRPFVR